MKSADPKTYLDPVLDELQKQWPNNKIINIVCHGHSVPAGYFATPYVNTFGSYPHLLHKILKQRFPFAVINVIVTAIGGENSMSGMERFETEVLTHSPQVITIDYAQNDVSIGINNAKSAWQKMIEKALSRDVKVILLTPSWDKSYFAKNEYWKSVVEHSNQIRLLAEQHNIGLSDTFMVYKEYMKNEDDLINLLSHINHPSQIGHELIAVELAKFFMAR